MLAARPVAGRFRRLRSAAYVALAAILFAIPWIRIAGEPLVLLDIPNRRFHVFGLVIFPQELFLLWLIIVGLALALFFFTALAGRLWCGWACPQTVFTDFYAAVARRIQGWTRGGPPRRIAPWRRVATHAAWIAISAVVGLHVVGYFHPIEDLVRGIASARWVGPSMGFWVAATLLCWLDFGVVQQVFCKYLCPYARFQSVLLDRDSLVVAYDTARGEPRGKARRSPHEAHDPHFPRSEPQASGEGGAEGALQLAQGDCVDCGLCVAVCPTGIDIRNGLQLECIGCTQCIDACNGVMARVGRASDLIAYRSLAALEGRRTRPLRPRVLIYAALLALVAIGFATSLARRAPFSIEIERNRSALYQRMPDGRIGNAYTLHFQNRDRRAHVYRIRLDAPPGYELVAGVNPLRIDATEALTASVFVAAPAERATAAQIRFVFEDLERLDRQLVRETTFLAPTDADDAGDVATSGGEQHAGR